MSQLSRPWDQTKCNFNWWEKNYWWSAGPITCTLVFRWSCQCWDGSSTLNQQYMVWTWLARWSAGQSSVRFRWSCTFSVGQGPPDHWLFWPLLICQYWLDFGKYSYTGQQPEWKNCELPWGASSVSDQSWPWEYIVFFSRIQKLVVKGVFCPHPPFKYWMEQWVVLCRVIQSHTLLVMSDWVTEHFGTSITVNILPFVPAYNPPRLYDFSRV